MKINSEELARRITEPDDDDIIDEVLAMSPAAVRAALRDLGFHLPTLHANVCRRARLPLRRGRRGFIRVGAGVAGLGGVGTVGALIWSALTTAAPVAIPIMAGSAPPAFSGSDTSTAMTASEPALELPDGGTEDAGSPTKRRGNR